MRRLFFALLLAIFATTPVSAANFYWKASTTDLNAIATPSAGDRGIVITDARAVSYWTYSGSAWVQAYASVPDLTGTYAVIAGTPSTTFQLDNDATGPLLKWDSGNARLMFRNSADSAYYDLIIKNLYVENINSTKSDGAYVANFDNTVDITFTPVTGDRWSRTTAGASVDWFHDGTAPRKVLNAGSLAADFPTLNQNTTGTAANLSGTPALPNGTTATTQTQADNSTKLATTAYVDTGLGGKAASSHTHTYTESFVVKSPVDADDFLLFRAPAALTLTSLDCVAQGSTPSITVAVQDFGTDGATEGTDNGLSVTADGGNDSDTPTSGAIASGVWLKVILGAPTGTVNFLSCTVSYTR